MQQLIKDIVIDDKWLLVFLNDGTYLSLPLAMFFSLLNATPSQRANWSLIAGGQGVRWEDFDEDFYVKDLLRCHADWENLRST
jgi:hypothetical protein